MRSLPALGLMVSIALGWVRAEAVGPDAGPLARGTSLSAETCRQDADCEVTNFVGCCACPQCAIGPPRARTRSSLRAEHDGCHEQRCNMDICAIAGMCPPGESAAHYTARCRAGSCQLRHR